MQILAIDQGTTSSRAIVFGADLSVRAVAQEEFTQLYPASGWVEHDPEEIWQTTLRTCRAALEQGGTVTAIGITNQRETVVIWDRATGEPIHNAIVWQDRRTADRCAELKAAGHEAEVTARTGLLLDPYFSATKAGWLLDSVPGARGRAERGELALGTIDSFLIWRLTDGRVHATDATNAARTMLMDIAMGDWDPELCALFRVPMAVLPEIRDCDAAFGETGQCNGGQEPDQRNDDRNVHKGRHPGLDGIERTERNDRNRHHVQRNDPVGKAWPLGKTHKTQNHRGHDQTKAEVGAECQKASRCHCANTLLTLCSMPAFRPLISASGSSANMA